MENLQSIDYFINLASRGDADDLADIGRAFRRARQAYFRASELQRADFPALEDLDAALARVVEQVHIQYRNGDLQIPEVVSGVQDVLDLAWTLAGVGKAKETPNLDRSLEELASVNFLAPAQAGEEIWSLWIPTLSSLWHPDYPNTLSRRQAGIAARAGVPLAVAAVAIDQLAHEGPMYDRYYPQVRMFHSKLLPQVRNQILALEPDQRKTAGLWASTWKGGVLELADAVADTTSQVRARVRRHSQGPAAGF